MKESEPIKVLVVDDHPVLRDGLKNIMLIYKDLAVIGEAENGEDALAFCQRNTPDVILMDVIMPGMGGIAVTRAVLERFPQVKIVMLTTYPDDQLVKKSLEAGAVGYLLKNADIDTIANAVRMAYAGQSSLAPEAIKTLTRVKTGPLKPGDDLSQRERDVLVLVVQGSNNEEIAKRLMISPATAKHHVSACIRKLGAANRTEAASLAVKLGLV